MFDSDAAACPVSQEHGGLDSAALLALGISPAGVLDFSVNVNPFGACAGVYGSLRSLRVEDYPDRRASALHESLARLNGVTPTQVLAGNGTAELIWLAGFAWAKMARVAILAPTFGEYARAATAVGAQVHTLWAPAPAFQFDSAALCTQIADLRPDVTFLCNPNNPSGALLHDGEVRAVAQACGQGLLILDEAYRSFVTLQPFAPPPAENVLVRRSMTKDFALAGLRLGYALGSAERIAALRALQPPWSVNAAAQAAGLTALEDLEHLRRTLRQTRAAALDLRQGLVELGGRVIPSLTPYCLLDVSPQPASVLGAALLRRGVQVRDCASFGLPQHVRIGTRRPQENARLLEAWQAVQLSAAR